MKSIASFLILIALLVFLVQNSAQGQYWDDEGGNAMWVYPTTTNIGIGTSSPEYQLHIKSTLLNPPYTKPMIIESKSNFLTLKGMQVSGNIYSGSHPNIGFLDNNGAGLGSIGVGYGQYTRVYEEPSNYNPQNALALSSYQGPIILHVKNGSNDIAAMVVSQGTGNVGIGTTSPSAKLNVNGTVRFQNLGSGTGTNMLVTDANGNLFTQDIPSGGTSPWDVSSPNIFYNVTNGKVGIGTDDPQATLDVNGSFSVGSLSTYNGRIKTYTGTSNSGGNVEILAGNVSNAYAGNINIKAGSLISGGEAGNITIQAGCMNSSGDLGDIIIEAGYPANPSTADALGAGNITLKPHNSLVSTGYVTVEGPLKVTETISASSFTDLAGNPIGGGQWSTTTGGIHYSSGKVGIGTDAPLTNFNIKNTNESTTQTTFTQSLTNAGILITTDYTPNAYTPGIFWSTTSTTTDRPKAGIYLKEAQNGTYMYLGTSNNYATGIVNNVVITPTGSIEAKEIKIVAQPGADFVFEEGYKLRSLNEVETFINENKHLPDVAPASSMEENGLELSKYNQVLLQKIEELTLYMIEQNKKLTEQDQKLTEQNQKIEQQQRLIESLLEQK
ncbi:MAG: TMF family protein [Bacteroidales bacterium]|nr:TMF family protein [Bacteroidales bacterium]